MSRNLYTFAVVTPALECEILDLLEAPESKKGPSRERRACDLIRDHLNDSRPPTVAYYREVLDGWNTTHVIQDWTLREACSFSKAIVDQLNARGFWHAPAAPRGVRLRMNLSKLKRDLGPPRDEAGWYGKSGYLLGWYHLLEFHKWYRCPAFCFWENRGGSCGDNEFLSQVEEYMNSHKGTYPRVSTLPTKPVVDAEGFVHTRGVVYAMVPVEEGRAKRKVPRKKA